MSESVDDIKMTGRKQNVAPMWKKLMKNVHLGFLDHVYLGCTQRECKPNESIIANFCYSDRKATRVGETSRKDGRMVLRHGRTCSKVCRDI